MSDRRSEQALDLRFRRARSHKAWLARLVSDGKLGHGDPVKLFPRGPRAEFDEACRLL